MASYSSMDATGVTNVRPQQRKEAGVGDAPFLNQFPAFSDFVAEFTLAVTKIAVAEVPLADGNKLSETVVLSEATLRTLALELWNISNLEDDSDLARFSAFKPTALRLGLRFKPMSSNDTAILASVVGTPTATTPTLAGELDQEAKAAEQGSEASAGEEDEEDDDDDGSSNSSITTTSSGAPSITARNAQAATPLRAAIAKLSAENLDLVSPDRADPGGENTQPRTSVGDIGKVNATRAKVQGLVTAHHAKYRTLLKALQSELGWASLKRLDPAFLADLDQALVVADLAVDVMRATAEKEVQAGTLQGREFARNLR